MTSNLGIIFDHPSSGLVYNFIVNLGIKIILHLRYFITLISIIVLSYRADAEHLVGGDISYECLGNNVYQVTLNVYRDCFSTGAPFDNEAPIGIYNGNGDFVSVTNFIFPSITNLSTIIDDECFTVSTNVCVERGTYVETLTLPPNSSGYYIVYQRCCRNNTIQNLNAPGTQGSTYVAFVPPSDLATCNSSPSWNNFPPIGVCLNIPLDFDHSASDSDGDDLVYELCTPYQGGTQLNPAPNPPNGPPFTNVVYNGGYNAVEPMDAMPGLAIDPATGQLTGIPTQIGQYVIGICVKEYRDGQLLSEVRRDFQFNVTLCPDLNVASIASQVADSQCEGLTVDFVNQSQNANAYLWVFGDGNTSTDFEPTYTYTDPGSYTVMLISDPGQICADTSFQTFNLYNPVEAVIGVPELDCNSGGPLYNMNVNSSGGIDASFWNFDGGTGEEMTAEPQGVYFEPGTYSINLDFIDENGCESNADVMLTVPLEPVAGITNNNQPCSGLDITFINESEEATNYQWDFGLAGDLDFSFDDSPSFTYPEPGSYTASLIASAPGTCPDTAFFTVEVTPAIFADFEEQDGQCFDGNEFSFAAGGNFGPTAELTWSFQNGSLSSFSGANPPDINFIEPGQNLVSLTAFQEGCETYFESVVNTIPNPQADFTFHGDGCVPMAATFTNLSFGGTNPSYKWNFGDGNTSAGQSPVNVYTQPGIYDVSLMVTSSGECVDSSFVKYNQLIEVNPSPDASFFIDQHQVDILDPTIQVASESNNSLWTCEFFVSDSTNYDLCNFEHEFDSPGSFTVLHIITNEFGCEGRAIQDVLVTGSLFWAPNAITMNGDGLNDFFKPVVLGAEEYQITIYDRWGQIMFNSNDPDLPWVPEYAHPGVYIYKVRLKEAGTLVHDYAGHFTIIR